jgi:hypothetical protein
MSYKKYQTKDAYTLKDSQEVSSVILRDDYKACFNKYKKIDCIRNLSQNLVYTKKASLKEVYTQLQMIIRSGQISSLYCHDISHKIGEATYSVNRNLSDGFQADVYKMVSDPICATGYYHGLLIGFSKDISDENLLIDEFKKIANKYEPLTEENEDNFFLNWKYIDMIHGIGHAMYINNGDLVDNQEKCKEISNNKSLQNYCMSGVFMEYSMQKRSVYLEAPPNFCESVKEEEKYNCLVGFRSSDEYLEKNQDEYVKYCSSQESDLLKYGCYKSFFSQVLPGKNPTKPKNLFDYCRFETNTSKKINCLEILEKTFYTTFHNKISNQTPLEQNLCLNFSPINYLRCMYKMQDRQYIEMVFALPKGS